MAAKCFRSRELPFCFMLLFAGAMLLGCSNNASSTGPAGRQGTPNSSRSTAGYAAANRPSAAEARQFGAELQAVIETKDSPGWHSKLDWDRIINEALADLPLSPPEMQGFADGFRKGPNSINAGLESQIMKVVVGGGSYQFLNIRERDGAIEALFRMLLPDGGVNYHAFRLAKQPDGVRAVDIFIYLSGEHLTATLRRFAAGAAAQESRNTVQRYLGINDPVVENIQTLSKVTKANREGRHADAWRAFKTLPEKLRKERMISTLGLVAAQGCGPEEYQSYLAEVQEYFPNDPTFDLVLLDYLATLERWKEYHAALDRLEKELCGDPHLNVLHGIGFDAGGKRADAENQFQVAIKKDPLLYEAYWQSFVGAIDKKEYPLALTRLTELADQFGITLESVKADPFYTELLASPEYKTWELERASSHQEAEATSDLDDVIGSGEE